jgi:type IV secretory pathway VirB4 component
MKNSNKTKDLVDWQSGIISKLDKIIPSYIDNRSPMYLAIDGFLYGGILIVDYYREYDELIFKSLIKSNVDMRISIFYERQDIYKTIKKLTYYIGNVGVDLKSGNQNREDVDLAAFSYNDAKYIRKEIQVNNEDLYFLYAYVLVKAETEAELNFKINEVESILQASGMQTKKGNFRQLQIFNTCLPLGDQDKGIKAVTRRNVLTNGLLGTFPFISSSIYDKNGIYVGRNLYDNSLVFIDRFDKEKYKNANMCIFGTSGAGKSYYTKLLLLRYNMIGMEQFVIDPEREYGSVCNIANGLLIKIGPAAKTYINILDIRKDSIEEGSGYLTTKLGKLRGFFSLLFDIVDEEQLALIEEKLIETYRDKGISFDDNTLLKKDKNNKKYIFKEAEDMPILEDLFNKLDDNQKYIKNKLYPLVYGSLSFLNHKTNVELENKLIVADIYELGEDNLKYGMFLFVDLFWDKIKRNRNTNKAIYLDEIWRLIGVTSNQYVASFIYKIFKTIRKYGGSSVAITQDISDLFSLEGGVYGKSILNNSSLKTFFSLEEENILVLEKYAHLSEKEKVEIKSLKRGESLMFIGENHVLVKIESTEYEKEVLK